MVSAKSARLLVASPPPVRAIPLGVMPVVGQLPSPLQGAGHRCSTMQLARRGQRASAS